MTTPVVSSPIMGIYDKFTQYDPQAGKIRPFSNQWLDAMSATTPEQVAQLNAAKAAVPSDAWFTYTGQASPEMKAYNDLKAQFQKQNVDAFTTATPQGTEYSPLARFRTDGTLIVGSPNDYAIQGSKGIVDPWYTLTGQQPTVTMKDGKPVDIQGANIQQGMNYTDNYAGMTPDEAWKAWEAEMEADNDKVFGIQRNLPVLLSTVLAGASMGLGAYASGVNAGGFTMGEAIKAGATPSMLSELGFSASDIAAAGLTGSGGSMIGNQLADLGLNSTVSNVAGNAIGSVGTSALNQAIKTGEIDPTKAGLAGLGTAVTGGLTEGYNGLTSDGTTDLTGDTGGAVDYGMGGTDTTVPTGMLDTVPTDTGLGSLTGGGGSVADELGLDSTDITTNWTDPTADAASGGFDWTKLIGPGVNAGIGLLGSYLASNVTSSAAEKAQGLQAAMYNQQRTDALPYMAAGYKGLAGLQTFDPQAGVGPQVSYQNEVTNALPNYNADPATVAQKALGQQALQRQLNARGLNYGATGASAGAELNQKYDLTGYDKYKGQLTDRYNALQGEYTQRQANNKTAYQQLLDQVKIGQGASGQAGTAATNYATQAGNSITNAGNADAGFYSGLGNLMGSSVKTGIGLNTLMNGGTAGTTGTPATGTTQNNSWF